MADSLFRIVSVGYAAVNRKLSDHEIEVTPVEATPYLDGELTDAPTFLEHAGVDRAGKKYTTKLEIGNTITAVWLQWGSNRITPPDIRRGERVLIWQYADADRYYWTALGMDDHLRRLETVIWAFSGTTDETVKVLTPDNSYTVEISTHKKLVTLRTSKANGEPYVYTFQINADKGGVTLADDVGNFLELNSGERRWTVQNGDGSYLKVDKRTILGYAADLIHLKTKDYILDASNSITENTSAATLNASATITRNTATYAANVSATTTFTTPTATFTGMVNTLGLLTMSGGFAAIPGGGGAVSGSITVPLEATAPVSFTDGLSVTGSLLNNTVNVGSTHTHISGAPGAATSVPS